MNVVFRFAFALLLFLGLSVFFSLRSQDLPRLQLSEDFRVRPNPDDHRTLWTSSKTSVAVSKRGFIYVVDQAENRLVEVDPQGRVVRQIGQTGEGPGEFRRLRQMFILRDQTAVAYENLQGFSAFSYFDESMSFQKRHLVQGLPFRINDVQMNTDGSLMMALVTQVDPTSREEINKLLILDKELNIKTELLSYRMPGFDGEQIANPGYWSEYLSYRFRVTAHGLKVFAAFGPDVFFTAQASHLYVTRRGAAGEELARLSLKKRQYRLSEVERTATIDSLHDQILTRLPVEMHETVSRPVIAKGVALAEYPPYKQPVQGLLADEDGNLIVWRNYDSISGRSEGEKLDPSGKIIGQVLLNNHGALAALFRNRKLYTLERNEEEELELVRYSYKWVADNAG